MMTINSTQPTPTNDAAPPPDKSAPAPTPRPAGLFGFFQQIRAAGREVLAVARGKPLDPPAPPEQTADNPPAPEAAEDKRDWKVKMLHAATEKLRGAADSYIAAKLDEIEVRVDAKLDHVEHRIDAKIVELHRQLRVLRDQELRHRLRILKITLIFTVLVACMSLLYKWLGKIWFS
jgi:hypothetical protein